MLRVLLRPLAALALAASMVGAQTPKPDPLHQSGQNVTISLLTMGTGEQVWMMFGHNAIQIHDNVTGADTVFNWGAFDFNQPRFIPRFLQGRMLYSVAGDSLAWIYLAYRYMNRWARAQELNLTATQKDSVLKQIQWYTRPENVNYRYDYFLDNCSTRVRDIIDNALHGQMKAQAQGLTGTTYRSHALRLMQLNFPLMVGVDIGLGRYADRELTKWTEMFLPKQLHDFVATLQVKDSTGAAVPLVRSERTLVESTRPPEPDSPPTLWPGFLGAGLLLAGLFTWLSITGKRRIASIVFTTFAVVAGILGILLTLLWTVTDHVSAHANENLLLFNPVWLVLAFPLAVSTWKQRPSLWAERLAMTVAALGAVGLLMHVIRLSAQDNLALIFLALPPTLAISFATRRRAPASVSP
jgi:hypothetical protein